MAAEDAGLRPPPDWADLARRLAAVHVATGFTGGVTRIPADQVARDMLSEARADEQVAEMRRIADLRGKRILEVGSGCGMLVVRGRVAHGLDLWGVEPSAGEYGATLDVARRLLDHYGLPQDAIAEAPGEALPFPDASFDVVYSSNVLEHVRDPQAVIDEAVRVLKPGGQLLFVVPNYGSWWEGHYGILWLPRMPAWLAKAYVRLLGRDPAYVDTLNLVDRGRMERWMARHAGTMEVLDWGWDVFEQRLRTLAFSEWAALATVKRIARLVHRSGLLELVLRVGRRLHWETPIILHARKRAP
ncbi:methyltransferase domain-containing protein [Azospirillum sp.]|uniref:class I SAM-dependent methyltransferase n=1 Tax=Azospirillum sp. TaxID=34012 RepID=UPI003D75FE82